MSTGIKSVGACEAKTKLGQLLDMVERGRSITITRHAKQVARLVPADQPTKDRSVFPRLRALRQRLVLPTGEATRDLVNDGRRSLVSALPVETEGRHDCGGRDLPGASFPTLAIIDDGRWLPRRRRWWP
jgi:prevent-host-death family protein